MLSTILYVIISVLIVSAASLVGIFAFFFKTKNIEQIILYLVSFSVGALLGDVFIHLLPEAFSKYNPLMIGIYALTGILFSFFIEKVIHWRHCHMPETKHHHHSFAIMNLIGDSVHNFIDGLIIATAYIVSIPVGIATTLAVLFHEIPQEMGNFGVLLHGGFTKGKALFFNFITALTAVIGAIIGLTLGNSQSMLMFLIPFAAGNLVYIAGTDLIPQLHSNVCEDNTIKTGLLQMLAMIFGIGVMLLLLFLG
jgi:zinc and cadmium transporter